MRKLKVKITLTEPMLGTKSANEELFTKFIAGKRQEGVAADEAEAERRMNEECDEREKSMTCFHRTDDGTPMLWDYQIKGFFKDACGALRAVAYNGGDKPVMNISGRGNFKVLDRMAVNALGGFVRAALKPSRIHKSARRTAKAAETEGAPNV